MKAYRPHPGDPHRSITFSHPSLGTLQGIVLPGDKVVQFHGIPYANISRRFELSTLLTSLDDTLRDFRYPGYACPHTFTMEDVYSGGPYPSEAPILSDEFECLTVTLSVPLSLLLPPGASHKQGHDGPRGKIPVMAYIHGGAFHVGKTDAVHDTALLVAQSISDCQPVVAASLQYRLGALGFLAAPGGPLNLGLRDQRVGLRWLQRFVGGFGGDENRITVFGESAGAYSICYHMLGPEPLFSRAVIMSGVPGPLMVPISAATAGEESVDICDILNISERGPAALDVLASLPLQKLVDAGDAWVAKGNFWRPVQDPSFFAYDHITWDTIPSLLAACPWVEALIVGNAAFEGTPYVSVAAGFTPSSFREHVRASLSEDATSRVLEAYGITMDMDQNIFTHAVTRWLGDVVFDAPIHALCQQLGVYSHPSHSSDSHPQKHTTTSPNPNTNTNSKNLYRYLFDTGNPFLTSPLYRVPHHWVDVYFLFGTLGFRLPTQKLHDLSVCHGQMWVCFANGGAPWGKYVVGGCDCDGEGEGEGKGDEKLLMIADEAEGWVQQSLQADKAARERRWDRLQKLWGAWGEMKGEAWMPLRLTEVSAVW